MLRPSRALSSRACRAAGGATDWAAMALDLVYSDQTHLLRDCKKLVGQPPGEYAELYFAAKST